MSMLRTSFLKLNRAQIRPFSAAAVRAAEGDLGGTRSGGAAASYVVVEQLMHFINFSSDSFNKREQASENKFIKEKEREA